MNASYSNVRKTMRILKENEYRYSGNGMFTKKLVSNVQGQTISTTHSITINVALEVVALLIKE